MFFVFFSHIEEWEDTPSSPLQKQNGKIQGLGHLAGVDDGQDVFLGCWEKNGASCGLLL